MFRHVVLLQWVDDVSDDAVAGVLAGLRALPELIPEIRSYDVGEDAGVNQGTFDVTVVADFDSVDDYLVYRDHPEHQAVIRERITPILAARAASQHHVA